MTSTAGARRKRLDRVREVWEEDLRRAAVALGEARARADAAQAELEETRARTRAAKAAKSALMGGASAEEWRAREAWIATCTAREERSFAARPAADRAVEQAMRTVIEAQLRIERLKLVMAKMAETEEGARRRAERREEDDLAARAHTHARGGT